MLTGSFRQKGVDLEDLIGPWAQPDQAGNDQVVDEGFHIHGGQVK